MPTDTATREIAPAAGIRFPVASRPQRRFSATQVANNINGSTSFQPIALPATGFVRKIALFFTVNFQCASAGAVVAGDSPWNAIANVSLTDATGQPILQPVSGYNLYLINKYFSSGTIDTNMPRAWGNPMVGPEYTYSATGTSGTAVFRLDLDLEIDSTTGYGCIPNLDSNASLQLKIDVAPYTNLFAGTGVTASTVSVVVDQHYWAPVGSSTGGVPNSTSPVGFGDFIETRYENQSATAGSENTLPLSNKGGLIQGVIAVSRAAGVRTAFTPNTNIGLVYDNNAVDEGIKLEAHYDLLRRTYGYIGADLTTSYAPLTPGTLPGLDRGVMVWNFGSYQTNRDTWLSTRVGTLLQLKATPGAGATQMEFVTRLAQVKDPESFYNEL
jgi:hypothetical protein